MLSNSERVGRRIRAARKAAKMSQAQLAETLSVSVRAVGGWESGASAPQPANLAALYDALPALERHDLDVTAGWPEDLKRFLIHVLGPALAHMQDQGRREEMYSAIIRRIIADGE